MYKNRHEIKEFKQILIKNVHQLQNGQKMFKYNPLETIHYISVLALLKKDVFSKLKRAKIGKIGIFTRFGL